jgi:hypothetical protein
LLCWLGQDGGKLGELCRRFGVSRPQSEVREFRVDSEGAARARPKDASVARFLSVFDALFRIGPALHGAFHFWVGAPSMLMVQPTHVMRIKPLNHPFSRVIAHVTSHEHEPDGQQDRQADHKANH